MNRKTALLLHAATLVLAVSGLVYAYMHYMMEPIDPFSVVNHPLEPYMLQVHLIAAPALVFLAGLIVHSHILFKWGNGARAGRRSGLLLASLFGVMVMSGYLLQVFTSTGHRFLFWLHLGSGAIWTFGYGAHQVSAVRVKRLLQSQRSSAVLALILAVIAMFAAVRLFAQDAEPLERDVQSMDTMLHIVAYGGDSAALLQNSEHVLRAVEETEAQLSTWRDDSELSRLNRQPLWQPFLLSPSLCNVLGRVHGWTDATNGAFDPSMGRLGEAWGIHSGFRIPDRKEIAQALRDTGMKKLLLQKPSCTATRQANLILDPGAFGKGEALDRALAFARFPMMLDFGGQIAVSTQAPPAPWEITLADPRDRSRDSKVRMRLRNGSLSTSGGSERDGVVDGRPISHIVDPRTGSPVPSFGSVTVWAVSAFEADVLSTALFVMGPRKGLNWANQKHIPACFLVIRDDRIQVLKSRSFVDKYN